MKHELILQAAETYVSMLDFHFRTIGVCWEKHKASEEAYEGLFDVLHETAEKFFAANRPKIDDDSESMDAYAKIESLKESFAKAIKEEEDEGVKNVLIQSYDSLQQICAKFYSVTENEDALYRDWETLGNFVTGKPVSQSR